MAQCSSFAEFSKLAGFCRFGLDGGRLPRNSRIYGSLPSHLIAGTSATIYKIETYRVTCSWNKWLPLKKTSLKREKCCCMKFVLATHGRKHVVPLAEDPRFNSSICIEEMDVIHERERLKEKICSGLESSRGFIDNEGHELISSLKKLNPYPDITICRKELYTGFFESVVASFKGTGKKGEAQKEVGASGTVVTLGRLAFNSFKPRGLEIRLIKTYNHVGQGSEDAYSINLIFSAEDDSTSSIPLEGLLINRARFSISNPGRMDVVFVSSTLAPRYPGRDLNRWLKLFKTANPDMDEKGSVTLSLPPAKGWLDYLYLDEDIRITKGNRGGLFVVRRMQEPALSV